MDRDTFELRTITIARVSGEYGAATMRRRVKALMWALIKERGNGVLLSDLQRRFGHWFWNDFEWFIGAEVVPLNSDDPDVPPTEQQIAKVDRFDSKLRDYLLRCATHGDRDRGLYAVWSSRRVMPAITQYQVRRLFYAASCQAMTLFEHQLQWREWGFWNLLE